MEHESSIARPGRRHLAVEGDTLARLSEINSNLPTRKRSDRNSAESNHLLSEKSQEFHQNHLSSSIDSESSLYTPIQDYDYSSFLQDSEDTNEDTERTSDVELLNTLSPPPSSPSSDEDYIVEDSETESEETLIWDDEEEEQENNYGRKTETHTIPDHDLSGFTSTLEAIVLEDESDLDSDIVQVYVHDDSLHTPVQEFDSIRTDANDSSDDPNRSRREQKKNPSVNVNLHNNDNNSSSNNNISRKDHVRKGQWTLGSKIGAGSFGVVHVGMNTRTGTLMAVKCIHMSHADTMEDLQREMDLMKSLNHINIVRYMGVEIDLDKDILYIFQEWVPGGSVSSLLSKFGPFPIPVVRSYLHQIVLGLQYLHSKHILHRDIKGGNVLVNDYGIVKLADFGASKLCAPGSSSDQEPMSMRGTPYFMAVEVFEENYGQKADIWSCAGVAFQMITANPPWKELGLKSPISLYKHLKETEGPPPISASLPSDIIHLLTQCFDRDARKRPSSSELLQHEFFLNTENEEEWIHSSPNSNKLLQSPPFLSPKLLSKSKSNVSSIQYDTTEWPEWAKQGLSDP